MQLVLYIVMKTRRGTGIPAATKSGIRLQPESIGGYPGLICRIRLIFLVKTFECADLETDHLLVIQRRQFIERLLPDFISSCFSELRKMDIDGMQSIGRYSSVGIGIRPVVMQTGIVHRKQLQDALQRLVIIVPITIGVIFCLLYGYFRNLPDTLLVLGSVPLALIGGVLALVVTGTDFSISAAVGFICAMGVATLNGVVLVSVINTHRNLGSTVYEAVLAGSKLRLRSVMMVAMAAGIGLLPAATATGIGSETQQPLARVVVGSMVTVSIVVMLALPALYLVVHRWVEARDVRKAAGEDLPEE